MADGKGSRPFNAANAAGDAAAEQRSSKVRRGDYFMCSFSPSDTARQSEKRSRFHEKFAHLINELCKHSPAFVQFDEKLIKKKALLFSRNICYVIDLFQFRSQTANEFLQRLPVFKSRFCNFAKKQWKISQTLVTVHDENKRRPTTYVKCRASHL